MLEMPATPLTSLKTEMMFYHLVAGKVLFHRGDNPPEEIHLNTTIITPTPAVPAREIGKAQQALQVTLFQREGMELTITDVFIMSISPLGKMTKSDFVAGVTENQNV